MFVRIRQPASSHRRIRARMKWQARVFIFNYKAPTQRGASSVLAPSLQCTIARMAVSAQWWSSAQKSGQFKEFISHFTHSAAEQWSHVEALKPRSASCRRIRYQK
jgi:hypothetical protein